MTGRNAGIFNTGSWNCFYGKEAGAYNLGNSNCMYGHHSGQFSRNWSPSAFPSINNCFYGFKAGEFVRGNDNCFIGSGSGPSYAGNPVLFFEGQGNTFVGAWAQGDPLIRTLNYSGGFGISAVANSNNKLIIGTNLIGGQPIHVGIGLSNDIYLLGPRSKLEINDNPNSTQYNGNPSGLYGSGLQFRQLTSKALANSSTPATYETPWGKVLTVDENDIVKLTDDEKGLVYGICNNIPTLPGNVGMKLNSYKIYYEGNGYSGNSYDMTDAIGLGFPCNDLLPGKLSVNQAYISGNVNQPTIAGYFKNNDKTTGATNSFRKHALLGISN
jgi:hypothetical protein